MRTRDEQLEEIFDLCRDSGVIGSYFVAKEIMTEIEQRVRAEIGERVSKLFDSYGAYDRPCKQFVMQAIDAAQENAND